MVIEHEHLCLRVLFLEDLAAGKAEVGPQIDGQKQSYLIIDESVID